MVKIVCIGDSLTFGQHLEDPFHAWPYLITGFDIHVAGVPSDTTRLGLERFPVDVQSQQAQGVVIQFGHNDANRWKTDRDLTRVWIRAYKSNLEEMVMRCLQFDAKPLLCTLTPSLRSATHALDVERYDTILRGVADHLNVEVIDVREVFGAGDGLLMEDGLHLTMEGHRLYAATVQKTLDEHFLT